LEVEFPNSAFVGTYEWPLIKGGQWRKVQIPIRYGFFRHPRIGPVLIDTGYSERVTSGTRSLDLRLYCAGLRPRLVEGGQLGAFLGGHGLSMEDVRAVILTHFHADHISAARDLVNAQFFACGRAYEELKRFSKSKRILHGVFLDLLPEDFAQRLSAFEESPKVDGPFGLGPCFDLFKDGSVLIVPLPGHAIGHVGVAFPRAATPLLYAADAEWLRGALDAGRSGVAAGLVGHDREASKASNAKALAFEQAGGRVLLCHDPEVLR
jgi:glyoxylase-like metal-dependent hydrolase (beta-lactamase superfamily II)